MKFTFLYKIKKIKNDYLLKLKRVEIDQIVVWSETTQIYKYLFELNPYSD